MRWENRDVSMHGLVETPPPKYAVYVEPPELSSKQKIVKRDCVGSAGPSGRDSPFGSVAIPWLIDDYRAGYSAGADMGANKNGQGCWVEASYAMPDYFRGPGDDRPRARGSDLWAYFRGCINSCLATVRPVGQISRTIQPTYGSLCAS